MPKIEPFEAHMARYESWFTRHPAAYASELATLEEMLPDPGLGLEIGVGTGRFAEPLGVPIGLDPSLAMLRHAQERGIAVVGGVAEALPFRDGTFDSALIVTTICFVDDVRTMLAEVHRVLAPAGALVIGFIDRETPLGRHYLAHQHENVFYRDATFFSAKEVDALLAAGGFGRRQWRQTLFRPLEQTQAPEPSRDGTGDGAFVAVRTTKAGAA